jgi:2',3'-cyclic-nucleotide 2'-phosphodiesterase (5'-nucleotidase family)
MIKRPVQAVSLIGVLAAFAQAPLAQAAPPQPSTFTILHTNDVHSHFRSDHSPIQLGGVTRLSTVIHAERAKYPQSLLLDGGDWSEGTIYYTEGTGAESIKMMDMLGYDAAVVGNHDWLNGLDALMSSVRAAGVGTGTAVIGANFDLTAYPKAAEFRASVLPAVIREVGGVRVAIIGIVNVDELYASFLAPAKSTAPAAVAEALAKSFKTTGQADVVIAVSHNAIGLNERILRDAPDLDLIVGGHDHVKLIHPRVVSRPGHSDAWVFEAGEFADYLGEVQLKFTPSADGTPSRLELVDSHLIQVDRSVPEDPRVVAVVDALEARIAAKQGPIFDDHVADIESQIPDKTLESPIGDLVTDAYAQATGADIAVDQHQLIYGGLAQGALRSVDVFNLLAPIYDPSTGKSWTLHTWTMPGQSVSMVFRLLYTLKQFSSWGGMDFSGFEILYDPLKQQRRTGIFSTPGAIELGALRMDTFAEPSPAAENPIHSVTVRGKAIDPKATYKLAASSGLIRAIRLLNQKYFNIIPLNDLVDTGVEDWRVVRDYLKANSPVSMGKIAGFGARVRTWQPDLGIVPGSVRWTAFAPARTGEGTVVARVEADVANYGGNASSAGAAVRLATNAHGYDGSVDAEWNVLGSLQALAPLEPGESAHVVWESVMVPADRGIYPIQLSVVGNDGETNSSNDSVIRYF